MSKVIERYHSKQYAGSLEPVFEALEPRILLSASQVGAALTLTATNSVDNIQLSAGAAAGEVVVSGVDGVADGTVFSGVDQITVLALGGNDRVAVGLGVLDTMSELIGVRVEGGAGRDRLIGGQGDDLLIGGANADTLRGGAGNDDLRGGDHRDLIKGGRGDDYIRCQRGDDKAWGGAGDDRIRGGTGNDRIYGQAGRDVLWGNAEWDEIYGGASRDRIWGGGGNDFLVGGANLDVIYGESGDDYIDGGKDKRNIMVGGPGGDIVFDGRGFDAQETDWHW